MDENILANLESNQENIEPGENKAGEVRKSFVNYTCLPDNILKINSECFVNKFFRVEVPITIVEERNGVMYIYSIVLV